MTLVQLVFLGTRVVRDSRTSTLLLTSRGGLSQGLVGSLPKI